MADKQQVISRADGTKTVSEIARELGCSDGYVRACARRYDLHFKKSLPRDSFTPKAAKRKRVMRYADGIRTARQIARLAKCSVKYVEELAWGLGVISLSPLPDGRKRAAVMATADGKKTAKQIADETGASVSYVYQLSGEGKISLAGRLRV